MPSLDGDQGLREEGRLVADHAAPEGQGGLRHLVPGAAAQPLLQQRAPPSHFAVQPLKIQMLHGCRIWIEWCWTV